MKTFKLITASLLLFAIFPLSYGYYQLLRIVVAISSGISAYNAYEDTNKRLTIAFALVLIPFNPIAPIYLSSGTLVFYICLIFSFFCVINTLLKK